VDETLSHKLTFHWSDYRSLTKDLSGTGGVLRTLPEDFCVEELPIYLPQGKGSHIYAWIEKRELTTRSRDFLFHLCNRYFLIIFCLTVLINSYLTL
jgi:tRNA(Glu) U13 pseudouridine synthase TruD